MAENDPLSCLSTKPQAIENMRQSFPIRRVFVSLLLACWTVSVVGDDNDVTSVYQLLYRVAKVRLPWSFVLDSQHCPGFCVDAYESSQYVEIRGGTLSDLTAGLGQYLKYSNVTVGWPLGGGSSSELPDRWPEWHVQKRRSVKYSSFMNVCTHSYSLVWYDQKDWEQFIDWLALNGINNILAMTGQEYLQHKIFSKLGVEDSDIRSWFNGPAFLTWSRGQNEYGSGIAGPLPMSWMKQQYDLQKDFILPRLRSLGIIGQLPGFQGNVPIQLKGIYQDANITEAGATGWMDSLDPLYSKIAKLWMETFVEHFGTDHWYQLDGYFNGGTAPWLTNPDTATEANDDPSLSSLSQSVVAPDGILHDETWYQRGLQAYRGLVSTDPQGVWSFQGFSFVGWDTPEQASYLKGFIDAADRFVIIDMSFTLGQWTQWNNSSFFGSDFIWTKLHNFGGTDGLKGDLHVVNQMPFQAAGNIVGIGATPEGINQNPIYYEFLFSQAYRDAPHSNLTQHIVDVQHRRYGLKEFNDDVAQAWALLLESVYTTDRSVQDMTGVGHFKPRFGEKGSDFEKNRYQPKPILCKVVLAWKRLLKAAQHAKLNEPFRYDLVNLGREVLAQISTPLALNFTDAIYRDPLDVDEVISTGTKYIVLLNDLDELVATDKAFLVGNWLTPARRWGKDVNDCETPRNSGNCEDFYEWNARCLITTWNPTTENSSKIPGGPIDYAAKHWSGLIKDYYAKRVNLLMDQALNDQGQGNALNQTKVDRILARHAYNWTTSVNPFPTSTTGDAVAISMMKLDKWTDTFDTCETKDEISSVAR